MFVFFLGASLCGSGQFAVKAVKGISGARLDRLLGGSRRRLLFVICLAGVLARLVLNSLIAGVGEREAYLCGHTRACVETIPLANRRRLNEKKCGRNSTGGRACRRGRIRRFGGNLLLKNATQECYSRLYKVDTGTYLVSHWKGQAITQG